MKNLGLFAMIIGVLVTLNSTFFTVINSKHNPIILVSFWGLLSLFEIYFAWILLFSRPQNMEYPQRLILVVLVVLTLLWIIMVVLNPSRNSIFLWAINTLSFSVLFFAGLLIYHRETKT